jgi:hypothetical protein
MWPGASRKRRRSGGTSEIHQGGVPCLGRSLSRRLNDTSLTNRGINPGKHSSSLCSRIVATLTLPDYARLARHPPTMQYLRCRPHLGLGHCADKGTLTLVGNSAIEKRCASGTGKGHTHSFSHFGSTIGALFAVRYCSSWNGARAVSLARCRTPKSQIKPLQRNITATTRNAVFILYLSLIRPITKGESTSPSA